jgi:hypothetical protein
MKKMKSSKSIVLGTTVFVMLSAGVFAQQLKSPAPSPTQTLKQNFALGDISIEYSRPGMKGRTIYGDLVPFDKVWRTGANASTKVTFSDNVKVEGNTVPAGTYSLYTIPGKTEWTIILNKNTKLWGSDGYKQEEDLVRFKVKPMTMSDQAETFTINIADVTSTSAHIDLLWAKTLVAFNVVANIDSAMMKNIETALSSVDKRPYSQAASYYFDNGKDLNKALEWVNKAVELNPKAFNAFNLKAKIQLKMKDYKGAIASAEQSNTLAKDAKNDEYVKMNDKIIEEAKKGR